MTILAAAQHTGTTEILPSLQARLDYRKGTAASTAGVANGFVQGNLAILPEKYASAFHRFCQLNPKPCPIIGISEVGNPEIPSLGIDLDIRPTCRVTASGATANSSKSRPTSWRIGATTSSPS